MATNEKCKCICQSSRRLIKEFLYWCDCQEDSHRMCGLQGRDWEPVWGDQRSELIEKFLNRK